MADPIDRFCYSSDPEIGVPGYYRHLDDGSIDTSVRFEWKATDNENPDDLSGEWVVAEHQYVRAEPKNIVPLQAEVKLSTTTTVGEEKHGFFGRKK